MGFTSFVGRVVFVLVFVISAWQETFDFVDRGPSAKYLKTKFNVFTRNFESHTGLDFPKVEMLHLLAGAIALKRLGSLFFIFNSSIGAFLLILYQAITTPILYDFYNYDVQKKEYKQLFVKFNQNLALFGALVYFIGMKNSMRRRRVEKKNPKSKTS